MSTISVTINPNADQSNVVRAVRPITGQSISEIRNCVTGSNPVYEKELFMNDFAEVADRLRALIAAFESAEIPFKVYEVVHGTTESEEISTEILMNMMEGSDGYA